jgi:hypothetical protein
VSGHGVGVVEKLTGSTWHVLTVPEPVGATIVGLNEVSCARPARCMAAGSYALTLGNTFTLAESWSGGSWQILKTVNR